ncbi:MULTISPECIES: class I SAM-dependent methyltransferase [Thermomonospora]|uniref:Methyltransferase type 11 n=1 Tax=Thermomonospora curvata (strain ATCC 19995 / DSM 43183 / JCM 3096 / KCTC 9072 / NBRC 15933 / NCIMB 10081 / Henssen B9) TaxID=471852 RepID=D1AE92_THECD|nr:MULTISPECIES: class I SAM-dependent methyltransferase [Thermomonospora]ACY99518.1 Methyltransferase type 11 [Thermomonospora curvata DSM 43183]PKK12559.1 MAG: class I SAM-dependent methyltransferase [Thermomonospora sp. CIF 1]
MGRSQTAHRATLARSVRLLSAFRKEQEDPEFFYGLMARDTVAQLSAYTRLEGATVIDVGAGSGFFTRELTRAGARCAGVDVDAGEITAHGPPRGDCVVGSALRLPFRTGAADVCFSSNVLEHVPDPWLMAEEMVRVTRPGGLIYLSFTNWLSPWGGHETSPWHYLGGHRAARRYERRHGRPPKNRYGVSLYPVSVGAALAWAERCRDVRVLDALPRYHPWWAKGVVRIPGVREIVTWNLVLVLRKAGAR